jgi:uncharacterized pyridoxal phosphate-containing UPF0001 family protein
VVSKKKSIEDILACSDSTGHLDFGENYANELKSKAEWLEARPDSPALRWHYIGLLQTGSLSLVAKHCSVVHTLCKQKHAQKLQELCSRLNKNMSVYLQLGVDPSKLSGASKAEVQELAEVVGGLPNLNLLGLMVSR